MKTKSIQDPKSLNKHKSKNRDKESGIAIVTVLSVLMMMTLLVFGFFSAATEELKSSTYYGSSLKTRQLTDVVTNMVIAQVRKATGEQTSEGQRFTWVSQPGCITTFSNRGSDYDTLSVAKFKLYSSETMEENADDNMVDDIQEDWDKKPHHYVDLNAPLYSERENELYFPILDPRARRSTNDTNKDNVEGVKNRIKPRIRWYENLDSSSKNINKMILEIKKKEGFIGTKEFYDLNLKIKTSEIYKTINDYNFLKKISSIVGKNVFPILQTSYLREYYLSRNNKFRSTIDTNLYVKNIKSQNNFQVPMGKEIMEIKYNINDDKDFRNTIVNKNFNFRFQKFSKYVTGLLDLKKNGFI